MAKKKTTVTNAESGKIYSFHLWSLAILGAVLVLAGGLLGSGVVSLRRGNGSVPAAGSTTEPRTTDTPAPSNVPAWGELRTSDIMLERPEEYMAEGVQTNTVVRWVFDQLAPDKVRELMLACGLSTSQIDRALVPERVSVSAAGTTVTPEDELVFSLSPKARGALYRTQQRTPNNSYLCAPFIFQGTHVEDWLAGGGLDAATVTQFKKLVYPRGQLQCFSDLQVMMRTLPSDKERMDLMQAVSRQPAVLVRLRVRPNTDVDKVIGYWSRGARVKDTRPLLESLTRLPDGGTVSLLYFLPPFARERLYTYPKTPLPNQPGLDCHWSSMNFFSETPDNRFLDASYTVQYIESHYYPVSKPTLYGDIILIVKNGNSVIHSAVYLADDIVFTKNGNNIQQPWTLMRMKDLVSMYDQEDTLKLVFQRQNNR